jgi:hypothetical protein
VKESEGKCRREKRRREEDREGRKEGRRDVLVHMKEEKNK